MGRAISLSDSNLKNNRQSISTRAHARQTALIKAGRLKEAARVVCIPPLTIQAEQFQSRGEDPNSQGRLKKKPFNEPIVQDGIFIRANDCFDRRSKRGPTLADKIWFQNEIFEK